MTDEGEDAFKEAVDAIQKIFLAASLKYSPRFISCNTYKNLKT